MYWIKVLILLFWTGSGYAWVFEYAVSNTNQRAKRVKIQEAAWLARPFSTVEAVFFKKNNSQSVMLPPYFEGKVQVEVLASTHSLLRDPHTVLDFTEEERKVLGQWQEAYSGYRYRQGASLEDCNEAARLLASIARMKGYEATSVAGLIVFGDRKKRPVYHAWTKIKIQRQWLDIDIFAIGKDKENEIAVVFGEMPDFTISELIK